MTTINKSEVSQAGGVELIAARLDCWRIYESDIGFHVINSDDELRALDQSIPEFKLVYERRQTAQVVDFAAAARSGDIRAMKEAIRAGADANAYVPDLDGNTGSTLLHELVTWSKKPELVSALLSVGADPNIPMKNGNTALSLAARSGQPHMVRALLEGGAHVLKTYPGGMPEIATRVSSDEIKALLAAAIPPGHPTAAPRTTSAQASRSDLSLAQRIKKFFQG